MRVDEDQLVAMALATLEEALHRAYREAVPRSIALRFAIAFLFSHSRGARTPFDAYWREVTREVFTGSSMTDGVTRRNLAEVHLAEIYRSVGVMRTPAHEACGRPKSRGSTGPI